MGHNKTLPSPHCAARALWAVDRISATQKRADRAPRKWNAISKAI